MVNAGELMLSSAARLTSTLTWQAGLLGERRGVDAQQCSETDKHTRGRQSVEIFSEMADSADRMREGNGAKQV